MKKFLAMLLVLTLTLALLAGCGSTATGASSADSTPAATEAAGSEATAPTAEPQTEAALPDGVYTADFNTDSSMFHVNEANDGKGELTVKDGKMTLHVSLASKNIVNLFVGVSEDAKKDGAELLEPTTDTVTYSDGMTEEVYGFDIPVPAIDEEFDLALIGKKNKWYDHKVKVTNPQKESDEVAEKTKDAKDTSKKASEKQNTEHKNKSSVNIM